MKKLIFVFILSLICTFHIKGQIVEKNDTLYLYFYNAACEFGGDNQGIIIYRNNDETRALGIRFNNSSYGIDLNEDSIIDFYKKNKYDYTVIDEVRILNEEQIDYMVKALDEIRTRTTEENLYSNANDHYVILSGKEKYVFIDVGGDWNKHFKIQEVLNIEQYPVKFKKVNNRWIRIKA